MNVITSYFRELGQTSWRSWNRFWFTPSDAATLGVMRWLAGAMLFYTHLVWGADLIGFFGENGRLPAEFTRAYHDTSYAWSHLYYVQSPIVLWVIHFAALVILLMFTIGCFTRFTSILAFLITVSYSHRAAGALFGLDQMNGLLALYLAVGPSGAVYSFDSWWRRRRKPNDRKPTKLVMANLSQRLIQVHMCVVYFFAGVGKLQGQTWWSGTALWGAFANYEYQTLDVTWLAGYPLVVNFLTQLILAWEVAYCVLVWPRLTRPLVLALAIPLHLGIAVGMGMITFGLAMLIGNVAFVSPSLIRSLVNWRPGQGRAVADSAGGHRARTPSL